MSERIILLELLFAGFFAVACIRSRAAGTPPDNLSPSDLLRFPGRLERLRRSRWQWFAMVLLMLVLRLQNELPLILEITVLLQFLLFMSLPARGIGGKALRRRENEATVGNH